MLAPGTGKTQTARLLTYARDERPWAGEVPPAAWQRGPAGVWRRREGEFGTRQAVI